MKAANSVAAAALALAALCSATPAYAGGSNAAPPDPCVGPGSLLAMLDRPTVGLDA